MGLEYAPVVVKSSTRLRGPDATDSCPLESVCDPRLSPRAMYMICDFGVTSRDDAVPSSPSKPMRYRVRTKSGTYFLVASSMARSSRQSFQRDTRSSTPRHAGQISRKPSRPRIPMVARTSHSVWCCPSPRNQSATPTSAITRACRVRSTRSPAARTARNSFEKRANTATAARLDARKASASDEERQRRHSVMRGRSD
jgi:hypothetical protein